MSAASTKRPLRHDDNLAEGCGRHFDVDVYRSQERDRRHTEMFGDQDGSMLRPSHRVRDNDRQGNLQFDLCGELVSLAASRDHQGTRPRRTSWDIDAHVQVVLSEAVGDGIQPPAARSSSRTVQIVKHTL
jgi:hypothetical protein